MTQVGPADSREILTPQVDFELDEVTVVVLQEGPQRSQMDSAEVQRLLNEHVAYTIELARNGSLLGAGAVIDRDPVDRLTGLGFSRLAPEELSGLIKEDPAVKVGLETFRLVRYRFPKNALMFPREQLPGPKK